MNTKRYVVLVLLCAAGSGGCSSVAAQDTSGALAASSAEDPRDSDGNWIWTCDSITVDVTSGGDAKLVDVGFKAVCVSALGSVDTSVPPCVYPLRAGFAAQSTEGAIGTCIFAQQDNTYPPEDPSTICARVQACVQKEATATTTSMSATGSSKSAPATQN